MSGCQIAVVRRCLSSIDKIEEPFRSSPADRIRQRAAIRSFDYGGRLRDNRVVHNLVNHQSMLFDYARHEAVDPIAWDPQRVSERIVRIVDDTNAAFTLDTLWPAHPLDLGNDSDFATALTPLYYGATGVIWALHYLDALGAARTHSRWPEQLDSIRLRNRTWLAREDVEADASYLMGELPILMLQHANAPTLGLEERLAELTGIISTIPRVS